MRLRLVAVGTRMPDWVHTGFREYAQRMPPECRLELVEIALGKRSRASDPRRAKSEEGVRMLSALARDDLAIALDVTGKPWSTEHLAGHLGAWLQEGRDVAFLVGGPDGLAEECLARAQARWSLSALTLPHALVRVVAAEALYRAWSLLNNHPYHRA